jgi:hypothetical protein
MLLSPRTYVSQQVLHAPNSQYGHVINLRVDKLIELQQI